MAPLVAQPATESWDLRVAALDIAGTHGTLWLRTGPGKEPVEIPLNTRVFSPPIDYKGPASLVFYRTAVEAGAEAPPLPIVSAVLKHKSSLIVFAPRHDHKTYQAFVVADDDFPFGSFRLINFSSATVRAELDRKAVVLKPGASESFAGKQAGAAIPVRIMAVADGMPPRLIRQSSWSMIPSQRELVLFFPNPDNGLVRLRHFVDTRAELIETP